MTLRLKLLGPVALAMALVLAYVFGWWVPGLQADAETGSHFTELGLAMVALVGLPLAAVVATLERSVLRPARQLARASRALARQDFGAPLPPATGDEIGTLTEAFAAMRQARKQAETALAERTRAAERSYRSLRRLNDIMALPPSPAVELLTRALALGCDHFGLELGVVSRIEGQDYTVLLHVAAGGGGPRDGAEFPLAETYCALTLEADDVVAVAHMGASPHAGHPCYARFGLEAYLGAPVRVRGRVFGTLNFSSAAPYEAGFEEGDHEFIRLLARWAGSVIERDLANREILAAKEDAEAQRIERELILASPQEGICGVDRLGAITFINPAGRRMLAWTSEMEGIGASLHDAVHHHHPDGEPYVHTDCPMFKTLHDGEPRRITDEVYWRKDGSCFPVEYAITPILQNGEITGAVVVFHDITERLAGERALLEKTEELKRSNEELEQFAYVASHDLREPLRMVNSYVALLERRYGGQLDAEAHEFMAFARDGAERMDRLILDLLEYSRIGRVAQPMAAEALGPLLDDALVVLGLKLEEAGGSIAVDGSVAECPPVFVSRGEVVRVFQNLVGNAIKYRHAERPPAIAIRAEVAGGLVQISIADNGIGIPAEYLERIFLIFQRLHARDQYDGTGIGLSICRKIVERHGGRIWAESTLGEGSVFHFTLPMAR